MKPFKDQARQWAERFLKDNAYTFSKVDNEGDEHNDLRAKYDAVQMVADAIVQYVLPDRGIEELIAEVRDLRKSLAKQWDAYQEIAARVDQALPTMETGKKTESMVKIDNLSAASSGLRKLTIVWQKEFGAVPGKGEVYYFKYGLNDITTEGRYRVTAFTLLDNGIEVSFERIEA